MEIGPVSKDQSAQSLNQAVSKKLTEEHKLQKEQNPTSDSVEISSAARARLAEAADAQLKVEKSGSSDQKKISDDQNIDRLDKIREKIEAGFYNQPGVKTIIVKKLLQEINPDNGTEK